MTPVRTTLGAMIVACAAAMVTAADAAGAVTPDSLTDEHVGRAIDALVAELYSRKQPMRFWDPANWSYNEHGQESQLGGYTALASLALLAAGQSYQDPRFADAIEHLQKTTLEGTYAVAVRAHVWGLLPSKFQTNLAADARWLMESFHQQQSTWSYDRKPRSTWYDNSLAQYGALGLWEAAKRDVAVQPRFWQQLEDRFVNSQRADGGWNYKDTQPVTGSMTAAGLTVLFITQDFLHAGEAAEIASRAPTPAQRAIDLGLGWMDKNFSASENPGKDSHFFYYLYGVERVGLASGYKYFGGKDWFRAGAAEIINRLCRIDPVTGVVTIHEKIGGGERRAAVGIDDLSFGLLFLCRGRVPVAMNKLRIDGAAWNNRPRDAANLTAFLRESTETTLNWQIVDSSADPEQWLDAPMIYVASHEALPEPVAAKLQRYLELGGMVFAVQEGQGRTFAASIERLSQDMSAKPQWRALPEDHWAYSLLLPVRGGAGAGSRPALRGLTNGVRELIILCPDGDLPRSFQLRRTDVGNQFAAATNIYLYASEMNRPRPRLAQQARSPAAAAPAAVPGATIVRASYDGNWNPEPMALDAFARHAAQRGHRVSIQNHPLTAIGDLNPRPTLLIVSGVEPQAFTDAEQDALRKYVQAGGVVLFETTGGCGEFATAVEPMASTLFNSPIRSLARTRLVTGEGLDGAARLTRVDFRPFMLQRLGTRETTPRLRGIFINDQPRVLFSREDMTHALLDQPCWGISGYSSASARDLLGNILLHAAAR